MDGQTEQTNDWRAVPYDHMVRTLQKPLGSQELDFLHAAVGMSTEVAELVGSDSTKNLKEELGDYEFYTQGVVNNMNLVIVNLPEDILLLAAKTGCLSNVSWQQHVNNLIMLTGDVLDLAKKAWVYEKPIDEKQLTAIIVAVYFNLGRIYEFIGVTTDEIVMGNREKLIGPKGRFKDMVYSNEAANARADKAPGEDRRFIGQRAA